MNKPEGCKQLAMSLLHNLYLNYVDYILRIKNVNNLELKKELLARSTRLARYLCRS